MSDVLLDIQQLDVKFPVFGGVLLRRVGEVHAVKGVSFQLNRGETLGLVGESGCGKTTVGRAIVHILRAMSYRVEISGRILYAHSSGVVDIVPLTQKEMRPYRADIQMVFQDPYSSLNPRKTVSQIVEEPLRIHTQMSRAERADRVRWLLEKVGLSERHVNRYPHEFSGGQRQRIGIARALATNPKIVIADEPVSALDVSIQAQVINLLRDLQTRLGLAYIFIAHDLAVVRVVATRIAVMYLGRIVEQAETRALFASPRHPYTRALLSAIPIPQPMLRRERMLLAGDVPNPMEPPSGCRFRTRCPYAQPRCAEETPALDFEGEHGVACHFWRTLPPPSVLVPDAATLAPNPRLERLQAAFRARPP